MNNKVKFDFLNSEVRKVFNFNKEGEIIIYQPSDEVINEILEMEEYYYKENKVEIPKRIVILELLKKVSNLDIGVENELVLEQMILKPHLWLKMVLEEVDDIILDINNYKTKKIANQIKQLNSIIENYEENNIEISNKVKDFTRRNQDVILNTKDKEFIESAKILDLIEIEEVNEEDSEIQELEERIAELRAKKCVING